MKLGYKVEDEGVAGREEIKFEIRSVVKAIMEGESMFSVETGATASCKPALKLCMESPDRQTPDAS